MPAATGRKNGAMPKHTTHDSFWGRVDTSGDCWPWLGLRYPTGYGRVGWGGAHGYAHRLAYTLTYGPIPDGLWVLHHCDNPPCCRPDHLFVGTAGDNARDRDAKGRNGPKSRPEAMRRGERHPRARLTAEQVAEIRRRRADGVRVSELARIFGVSITAASFAIRGKTWRHLPMESNRD